jgi:hypothetical protein
MGFLDWLLGGPQHEGDWNSGYHDGYADAQAGRPYRLPPTSDQAAAGYAFGYGDGDVDQQLPGGW